MTVDTNISKSQIDLAPAIRTFRVVVRQLRQYKEGVTKLPQIGVCTIDKIPDFVKVAAGYIHPKADEQDEKNIAQCDVNDQKQYNNSTNMKSTNYREEENNNSNNGNE